MTWRLFGPLLPLAPIGRMRLGDGGHYRMGLRPMMRPDFTTPPHPLALWSKRYWGSTWLLAAMRRIWAVSPSAVSPRCWRWLTMGYGPPWRGEAE